MNGTLSLLNSTLAYGDVGATSNPVRRYVDWKAERNYPVGNPKAEPFTVDPGATLAIFSGVRATTVASDTQLTLTLSPLDSSRYRFTWTGGTDPSLRTDRGLTLSTSSVEIVVNANQTVSMTTDDVGGFTAVLVGDVLFIPGVSTGDTASPFNAANEGNWVVLSKDGTNSILQLARPLGDSFLAAAETVLVPDDANVQAFSFSGVQVGDSVDISAGFDASVLKKYTIAAVTSKYFEVVSTSPLPVGVAAEPDEDGIAFYVSAKRYVRIEADQDCSLLLNGSTDLSANRLTPWVAADAENTAFYEKAGPCWSLSVVNRSNQPLNFLFISAE